LAVDEKDRPDTLEFRTITYPGGPDAAKGPGIFQHSIKCRGSLNRLRLAASSASRLGGGFGRPRPRAYQNVAGVGPTKRTTHRPAPAVTQPYRGETTVNKHNVKLSPIKPYRLPSIITVLIYWYLF
jgi:hypothetical protein